jgi:hypothetical protein
VRENHPPIANGLTLLALVWVIWMASLSAPCTPAAVAGSCSNEAIRAEQGPAALSLPDCRAYELVSPGSTPLVSSSGDVNFGVRAANDGDAIAYFSYYPFQGATSSGFFFRARRSSGGWAPEAMTPQVLPGAGTTQVICDAAELNYSENLLASVLRIGRDFKEEYPGGSFCPQPQVKLVPEEPRGFANLLRRGAPESPYELVNRTPADTVPANAQFQDASDDLSHIVFGEAAQLTPEAPPGYNLYLWADGVVRLVSFLPNGVPVRGDLAGATQHSTPEGVKGGTFNGTAPFTHAVSSDGERIFFYANGSLYLRENAAQPAAALPACGAGEPGLACTRQIDRSFGEGDSGGGVFQYASADGSRVFFTDESKLTSPSSAATDKPALYEYNVETRALADRTPGVSGANVRGFSGAARDGSRLYFVARSALTGAQQNSRGEAARSQQPNLYLLEDGILTFIATLDSDQISDQSAWSFELAFDGVEVPTGGDAHLKTRTSPDGRYFAFNSTRPLTGGSGGTFVYDAVSGSLSTPGSSFLSAPIMTTELQAPAYLPRAMTDDGQLYFTTTQALLSGDTDAAADVYEYCKGHLYLISDGGSPGPSFFFDASAGGDTVFFATSDPLVRSDTDNALNLYAARVDGGFSEPPPPARPCTAAEPCRGASFGITPLGPLPTSTGSGPGNVRPANKCRRGQVKRHRQCVKKPRHRKHPRKKGAR